MHSTFRSPGLLRWIGFLAVTAMLLGVTTCGGNSSTNEAGSSVPLVLAALMPPIPQDQPGGRGASVAQPTTINGNIFFQKSAGASVSGSSLQLVSSPGTIEWGIYEYATNGHTLLSVKTDFTPQTGNSIWLARANFSRQAWDFNGPYTSGAVVPLTADYVSPGGTFFFAILTYNGASILVNTSTVTADVPLAVDIDMTAIPHHFDPQTVNVDPGTAITWHNIDAVPHTVTTDPLNAAPGGPDSDSVFATGVPSGGIYSFTVPNDAAHGTKWFYHCRFHGLAGDGASLGTGMTGEIIVN